MPGAVAANRHRGEIVARLDGKQVRLCLTLGALAELEGAFEDADMVALASRFESGRLSARDAMLVIAAGLRGAGHEVTNADVAHMRCDDGAAGYVAIVVALLEATFGGGAGEGDGGVHVANEARQEVRCADPFPGTT